MGIVPRVVQFFTRPASLHQVPRGAGQPARRVQVPHQRLDEKAFLLVAIQRGKRRALGVGANQVEARLVHGSDALDALVDAVAGGEGELPRRVGAFAEEDAALHQRRSLQPGEGQRRGRHIDEAHDAVAHGAGRVSRRRWEVLRPFDDQGDAEAGVVTPVDAPRIEAAVVAEKHDDGVVLQAVAAQAVQHPADAEVQAGNGIEVARPLLAHDGVVRIIGRGLDVFRRGVLHVFVFAHPLDAVFLPRLPVVDVVFDLVRVDDGEERRAARE